MSVRVEDWSCGSLKGEPGKREKEQGNGQDKNRTFISASLNVCRTEPSQCCHHFALVAGQIELGKFYKLTAQSHPAMEKPHIKHVRYYKY